MRSCEGDMAIQVTADPVLQRCRRRTLLHRRSHRCQIHCQRHPRNGGHQATDGHSLDLRGTLGEHRRSVQLRRGAAGGACSPPATHVPFDQRPRTQRSCPVASHPHATAVVLLVCPVRIALMLPVRVSSRRMEFGHTPQGEGTRWRWPPSVSRTCGGQCNRKRQG